MAFLRRKLRDLKLSNRIMLFFILPTIIISITLTFFLYNSIQHQLKQNVRTRLQDLVASASLFLDAETHSRLTEPGHEGNPDYLNFRSSLQRIRDSGTDIYYVYTMREDPEGRIIFVVDAETNPEEIAHLGDEFFEASKMLSERFSTLDEPVVEEEFIIDRWGTWLSGYAPFYSEDGTREGVIGMDIEAGVVASYSRNLLIMAIAICATIILFAVICGLFLSRTINSSIRCLIEGSELIAQGHFDYRVPAEGNDEFGMLGFAFNKMAGDLENQASELNRAQSQLRKERDRLEEMVNERTAELEEANQELDTYAYTVSHDLRGPLTGVPMVTRGLRSMCEKNMQDKELNKARKMLDAIDQSVGNAINFARDILVLARAGNVPRQTGDLKVREIVDRVLQERNELIQERGTRIEVDEDMGTLKADNNQIYQIFTNLIGNAIKYNDNPEPEIRISYLGAEEGMCRYLVRDNGSGIPEDQITEVFKPFYTGKTGGTGLGLATVKKQVRIYNGTIKAYNDRGACFEFTVGDIAVES